MTQSHARFAPEAVRFGRVDIRTSAFIGPEPVGARLNAAPSPELAP